jgi:histone H4
MSAKGKGKITAAKKKASAPSVEKIAGQTALKVKIHTAIAAPTLRRLGRRAAVKRIYGSAFVAADDAATDFKVKIMRDALKVTEYCRRKTVFVTDVLYALKRHDALVYGFNNI